MANRIKNPKKLLKKIIMVLIGTFIYSAGVGLFLDPNGLAPGGVVGISVIVSHIFGGATGTWYFLFNIPIVLLGWWQFGGRFIIWSFLSVLFNSLFTNLFSVFPAVTNEHLLAALAGSILTGVGIGIVLRSGATTGGTDIIIKVLRRKYPAIKTSTFFMVVDVCIVAAAGILFRDFNIAMYAFIAVVVAGRVMDYVLYGKDEATLVFIISDKADSVLARILEEISAGATILTGRGAYSQNEKNILMCVVKKRTTPDLEDIVKEEDSHAFMIVTSASEIYGEGYKNILKERL
ncbi:MAG: YitT family protein [Lachnospiraceae bacterium]|nr:YitT family protein [Lachnospiraceae bacterium]